MAKPAKSKPGSLSKQLVIHIFETVVNILIFRHNLTGIIHRTQGWKLGLQLPQRPQ
jgi:hypothetical protein